MEFLPHRLLAGAVPAIDMRQDLGDGGEGDGRDALADIERGQDLDQVGILAHLDAMLEGDIDDTARQRAGAAGDDRRTVGSASAKDSATALSSLSAMAPRDMRNDPPA